MLSKLIKYDMKALNRFLIIIHFFLLVTAVLGRILLTGRIDFASKELNLTLLMFSFLLYFLIFMTVSMGTYIIIGVRFYKNVFSDEGYFTLTLPVTRSQILLSKTVAAGIWSMADIVLIYISAWILIATPAVTSAFEKHRAEFLHEFGFSNMDDFYSFLIFILIISLIGAVSSVIMIHSSVMIGQLFSNHKVLGAVISYFAISTILSLISTAAMMAAGVFTDSIIATTSNGQDSFIFYDYMSDVLNITIILSVVMSILLYGVSYIIIKKKINLT